MRHMSTETRKYYFKQAVGRCKPIQLKYAMQLKSNEVTCFIYIACSRGECFYSNRFLATIFN